MKEMQELIKQVTDEIKEFLLKKNIAYGNSAAEPVRIFSKADPLEQINVRIDDKLSRMMKGKEYPGDDDELDLIGYLILKRAVKLYQKEPKPKPKPFIPLPSYDPVSNSDKPPVCFGKSYSYLSEFDCQDYCKWSGQCELSCFPKVN